MAVEVKVPTLVEGDKIALVGNPNVGKSVVFGVLTGRYVVVSNYPGTTVEVTRGSAKLGGLKVEIIDTPGAGSLIPMSEDEEVTRNILLKGVSRAILVADSKNLERSLGIALQLAEAGVPFVVALNMSDEARSRGMEVDYKKLSAKLGVETVVTVATRREGLDKLAQSVVRATSATATLKYDADVEAAVAAIAPLLEGRAISARSLALMFLAGDKSLAAWAKENLSRENVETIEKTYHALQERRSESIGYALAKSRRRAAEEIVSDVVKKSGDLDVSVAHRLGELMMHRVYGWFVLALVLWLTYEFVGRFGAGTLVDLLEHKLFGGYVNPFMIHTFDVMLPWSWAALIREAFVGEYGMLTVALTYSVAIILPIVSTFFIVFGLLEDSGYLPRLAVMSNRAFKLMGLNGKAVLPMVLGLGCGTMAALTSRILETRKERVLVILLLALGVPCSAQLGVILGMLHGVGIVGTLIWIGTLLGVMLLVGWLAAKVVPGESADFILELPPVRTPQIGNILIKTFARIEWYLKEAVPLFVLGTFLLFFLNKTGVLHYVEMAGSPIVQGWLHLPAKATEAFIVGFLRRDYGAAGLYGLRQAGQLDDYGVIVGMVTITLFIPCIANFFIIVKELGVKSALLMAAFVFTFAFVAGGLLNAALRGFHVPL